MILTLKLCPLLSLRRNKQQNQTLFLYKTIRPYYFLYSNYVLTNLLGFKMELQCVQNLTSAF